MFLHYRTCGIVLKKEDRGEADQLLTIYTKDFGKIEVLGKAIRKINSKLRSGADLFVLSEIEFIQGKTHKTLTDAIPVAKFYNIKKSLARLRFAFVFSDLISALATPQEADPKQEALIKETFHALNNPSTKTNQFFLLYLYFFWNFINKLGYAPEVYRCVICEKSLTPGALYFFVKSGGVVCSRCFTPLETPAYWDRAGYNRPPFLERAVGSRAPSLLTGFTKPPKEAIRKITPETVKILRIIMQKNWPVVSRIKIEFEQQRILETITQDYQLHLCV